MNDGFFRIQYQPDSTSKFLLATKCRQYLISTYYGSLITGLTEKIHVKPNYIPK